MRALSIEAVYEQGVLRPLTPLDLVEGARVEIILIEPLEAKLAVMRQAIGDPLFLADLEEVADDFKHVDAKRWVGLFQQESGELDVALRKP